jgi:hypothetical protein
MKCSVANRPKVAPEKSQRPRKSAAEFYAEFPKNGRKGAELLEVCFSLKILDNLQNSTLKSHDLSDFFPITMHQKLLIKLAFFRKDGVRSNFSVDLADNLCQKLATLMKCLWSSFEYKNAE